jgi:ABC-type multidrug transport system permease subunit
MHRTVLLFVALQFKEFWREPAVLFWSLLFPMGLAGILGFAFSAGDRTPTIPVALQGTDTTTAIYAKLKALPHVVLLPGDSVHAQNLVKKGKALLIATLEDSTALLAYDPAHEDAKHAAMHIQWALAKREGYTTPLREKVLNRKGVRYIDFLLPGLLALGIMNSCIWGVGWNLMDLRIKKLMRRMVATPMQPGIFLLAQLLARLGVAAVEFCFVLVFGMLVFGIEVQGAWAALGLLFIAGIVAFGGLGVVVGSRAANPQVGNGLINAATLPMMLLSGIFFSYSGFPAWSQVLIEWLPLTLLADALRAVCNEGAGLTDILLPAGVLCAYGIAALAAGVKMFRWY